MAVERERLKTIAYSGTASPCGAERHASGRWSVEIALDFVIHLRDGREVHIKKHIRTQSTEQRGRKKSATR
jgi:hypothetical protein